MFKNILSLFNCSTPLGLLETLLKIVPFLLAIGFAIYCGVKINDYVTADLKEKISKQQIAIKELSDTNKNLNEVIIQSTKSKESTITVIEDNAVQISKINKKSTKIESDLSFKMKDIDKTFDESPKAQADVEEHITNVSSAEIDSIWQTFCSVSPDNPQCKE